jgi:hypothetical protein
MPSVSQDQHNLMGAAKHSASVRAATGITEKVAADFIAADKGGRFDRGDYQGEKSSPHHKKARPPGKWHDQHSGHPRGA